MRPVLRGLLPGALLSLAIGAVVLALWTRERSEQERLRARCEALEAESRELEALAPKQPDLEREVRTLRGQRDRLLEIAPASAADAERRLAELLERRGVELIELISEDAGPYSELHRWLRVKGRVRPVGRSGLQAFSDKYSWPLFVVVEELSVHAPRDPESELAFGAVLVVRSARAAP